MDERTFWKKCSSCKKEMPFGALFYVCSVSTCRRPRTGFQFCSVPCWDAHLGYANHRGGAFAEEKRAPSEEEFLHELAAGEGERAPKRIIVEPKPAVRVSISGVQNSTGSVSRVQGDGAAIPQTETLVVVSRVKDLISSISGFNTSQCCIDALTKIVAEECTAASERARAAGRKTVMGRDIAKGK